MAYRGYYPPWWNASASLILQLVFLSLTFVHKVSASASYSGEDFLSLDYESSKICLVVTTTWREFLTAELYPWKAKSVFHGEIVYDEVKLWQAGQEGNVEEVQNLSGSILADGNCVKGSDHSMPLCEAALN